MIKKDFIDRNKFPFAAIELRTSGLFVLYQTKTRTLSLPYLQRVVDGSIDIVKIPRYIPTRNQLMMVVNDEGLVKGLPFNHKATLIYGDHIAGNVVIGIHDTKPEPDVYAMPIEDAVEMITFLEDFYIHMRSYD